MAAYALCYLLLRMAKPLFSWPLLSPPDWEQKQKCLPLLPPLLTKSLTSIGWLTFKVLAQPTLFGKRYRHFHSANYIQGGIICWSEMPANLIGSIKVILSINFVKIYQIYQIKFVKFIIQKLITWVTSVCKVLFLNGLRFTNRMILDEFIAPSELIWNRSK